MATIKTKKYEMDGKELEVRFNCSTSGLFSTNLNWVLAENLGLDKRLEYSSLKDLESIIDNAFLAYKDANTAYSLKIGIKFGASGEFRKLPGTEDIFIKSGSKHYISASFGKLDSIVGIDFRVLIEENRDGRITYYKTESKEKFNGSIYQWNKEVEGFIMTTQAHIGSEEKLINYTENTVTNLNSIVTQFQKAAQFISEIMNSDNTELILSSNNMKALNR